MGTRSRNTARREPVSTADAVRLIVTTREKFPRNAQWNRTIRRTLFRLLQSRTRRHPSRRKRA